MSPNPEKLLERIGLINMRMLNDCLKVCKQTSFINEYVSKKEEREKILSIFRTQSFFPLSDLITHYFRIIKYEFDADMRYSSKISEKFKKEENIRYLEVKLRTDNTFQPSLVLTLGIIRYFFDGIGVREKLVFAVCRKKLIN